MVTTLYTAKIAKSPANATAHPDASELAVDQHPCVVGDHDPRGLLHRTGETTVPEGPSLHGQRRPTNVVGATASAPSRSSRGIASRPRSSRCGQGRESKRVSLQGAVVSDGPGIAEPSGAPNEHVGGGRCRFEAGRSPMSSGSCPRIAYVGSPTRAPVMTRASSAVIPMSTSESVRSCRGGRGNARSSGSGRAIGRDRKLRR